MSYRTWAYVGLGVGLTASVTANVASTVLKETTVPLGLRVPFAVIWPLLTYLAIEILARTPWSKGWKHASVRVVLSVPVGLVAAFVSYLHQHDLMVLGHEPGLAQGFGPLAVDGLLFGAAFVLVSTRKESISVDEVLERWSVSEDAPISPAPNFQIMEHPGALELELQEEVLLPMEEMDDSEARSVAIGVQEERDGGVITRSSWDARMVAEMILSGAKTTEITEKTGAKPASIGRFRKVARMIQTDARVTIDPKKEKVTSDNIRMIRELVAR